MITLQALRISFS